MYGQPEPGHLNLKRSLCCRVRKLNRPAVFTGSVRYRKHATRIVVRFEIGSERAQRTCFAPAGARQAVFLPSVLFTVSYTARPHASRSIRVHIVLLNARPASLEIYICTHVYVMYLCYVIMCTVRYKRMATAQ